MTLLLGDRYANPYLVRDRDRIEGLLPPGIDRVTATHGGTSYSVYLYSGDRVVGQAKGAPSVLVAVQRAAHEARETA